MQPGKTYYFRVAPNSYHGEGKSSEIVKISTLNEENIVGEPKNLQVNVLSHHEIYLKWDPPNESIDVTKYRIFFTEGESSEDQIADTTSTEFMLTQLKAYCEYTISVAAMVSKNSLIAS